MPVDLDRPDDHAAASSSAPLRSSARRSTLDAGHGAVTRPRLHISSLGIFEAALNGRPVGDDVMSPGWSAYEWRLRYRTYDVTQLLDDTAVLAVPVGNGWYRGRLGFVGSAALYGSELGVIAQLEIDFADGHQQLVVTDETWKVTGSDVLADDLYDGQTIDARRRMDEWYTPFAASEGMFHVDPVRPRSVPSTSTRPCSSRTSARP